jgi:hypothetical protein
VTTVVKLVPSALVWMLNAPVFQAGLLAAQAGVLDDERADVRADAEVRPGGTWCRRPSSTIAVDAELTVDASLDLRSPAHAVRAGGRPARARLVPRLGAAGGE